MFMGFLLALPGSAFSAGPKTINSCTTISERGIYVLAADLTSTGTCIKIRASDVYLALMGHIISGTSGSAAGTSAIEVVAVTNVTIVGPGGVRNFGSGVNFEGVHASRVSNVTSAGNFMGFNVNADFVTPNPANLSQHNNFVGNVSVGNNQHGFSLNGASNNTFVENNASGNGSIGIYVYAGTGNLIEYNTAISNDSLSNGSFDLDDNNPNCDSDTWANNTFLTANQTCID